MMKCGFVALVGRPNVGKSTLLNRLVGQKVSIVSRKPQTTRMPIKGILSTPEAQFIFVDTPGYQTRYGAPLNRAMNRSVGCTLNEVHAVLFVVEMGRWDSADEQILTLIEPSIPIILVVNKIDRFSDRLGQIAYLQKRAETKRFGALVPISAYHDHQFSGLLKEVGKLLPESSELFSPDEVTDSPVRFLVAEFIREGLFRLLGEELPYQTMVLVEGYREEQNIVHINATIIVNQANQKSIVIGKGGAKLKDIGTHARCEIEHLIGKKVFLELWVKVKKNWSDNERFLREMGYGL